MIIGRDVRRFAACGSTMDEARALALAGAPEGTVVVAAEQTAGRGTRGRRWHSPPGLGLYATVILRPSAPAAALAASGLGRHAVGVSGRGHVERGPPRAVVAPAPVSAAHVLDA